MTSSQSELVVQAIIEANERLTRDNGLLQLEAMKLKAERDAQESLNMQLQKLLEAGTVGHNLTIGQLAQANMDLEACEARRECFREFLFRIRHNPLASFFLSSRLCAEIDKEIRDGR